MMATEHQLAGATFWQRYRHARVRARPTGVTSVASGEGWCENGVAQLCRHDSSMRGIRNWRRFAAYPSSCRLQQPRPWRWSDMSHRDAPVELLESSPSKASMRKPAETLRPPRTRSKKDTARWCRGKVGREHEPVTRLDRSGYRRPCGPTPEWAARFNRAPWICRHETHCAACGKVLQRYPSWSTCPELTDEFMGSR